MAITLRTRILVWATADGESTSFVFDLFKSQFWIGTARPSGFGGHSPNFFTERAAQLPSGWSWSMGRSRRCSLTR